MARLFLQRTLLAILCTLVSGCRTSYSIRPDTLDGLAGFNAATPEGNQRVVESTDGEKVEYSRGRALLLTTPAGKVVGGSFTRIDARARLLEGALVGGGALTFDPTQVQAASISHYSPVKTAILLTALSLLSVGIGLGLGAVIGLSSFRFGGF